MRLLIAGDSYAQDYTKMESQQWDPVGWPEQLKLLLKCEIKNIAWNGTGLAWTYKRLKLENFDNFDKIIVIVSSHNRGYTKDSFNQEKIMQNEHLTNYNLVVQNIKKIINDPYKQTMLNAVKLWYEFIRDEELEIIYHKSLIEEIKNLVHKEKLILLNGCCKTNLFGHLFDYDINLVDITYKEVSTLDKKIVDTLFDRYIETTSHPNHMIASNNKRVALYIKDIIEGRKPVFNIDDYDVIKSNEFNLYYQPI